MWDVLVGGRELVCNPIGLQKDSSLLVVIFFLTELVKNSCKITLCFSSLDIMALQLLALLYPNLPLCCGS